MQRLRAYLELLRTARQVSRCVERNLKTPWAGKLELACKTTSSLLGDRGLRFAPRTVGRAVRWLLLLGRLGYRLGLSAG